jgi:hypothetical protein
MCGFCIILVTGKPTFIVSLFKKPYTNITFLFITFRKFAWFVGAVQFYFQHQLGSKTRFLALVRVSRKNKHSKYAKYIPMVIMDERTDSTVRTGIPQVTPFEDDDYYLAVIDVASIRTQVGLLSCIDTTYFRVVSKDFVFRNELVTNQPGVLPDLGFEVEETDDESSNSASESDDDLMEID